MQPHALEERIYRLRCVEAWSMVIPWVGFPLADLVKRFEPTSQAKYVQFFTLNDRTQMPGVRYPVLEWPYREGLTIAEAMHPLAFVAVGLYGKVLPNQNGAPMRTVLPWKYGFKSCKSIVRIHFTDTQPQTSWNMAAPQEYGFYSNVNPRGRSSALEPGDGTAPRRRVCFAGAHSDADVQRLRRPGRQPLHGSRPRQELLTARGGRRMTQRWVVIVKTALWAACLAPLGLLVLQAFGYAGGLGANPVEQVLNVCGKTGLNLLMLTLCITPIRRSTGINKLVVFRRLLGLFAFFYRVDCTS